MRKLIVLLFMLLLVGCNGQTTLTTTQTTEPVDTGYVTEDYLSFSLYHNKNSSFNPFVIVSNNLIIYEYKLNTNIIGLNDVSISSNNISFNYNVLNSLETGEHTIVLLTTYGYINIELTIVDDDKPYIIGSNTIRYNPGQDIVVMIETFGEGLTSISTTGDIASNLYSFSGRTLTIKKEFFVEKLNENPSRKSVIFMIPISYGEGNTLITAVNVLLND